jgi:hypothetical protein
MKPIRILLALAVTLALPAAALAQATPPGGTIYAFDEAYTTTATPADVPDKGRFDALYVLGEGLAPVSDAAPGHPGYNGGRWEVRPVTFVNIAPTQFTNADAVRDAAAKGDIQIGDVMRRFVCPLHRKRDN